MPPYVESCSSLIVQQCSVNETADMYTYGETTKLCAKISDKTADLYSPKFAKISEIVLACLNPANRSFFL